MFRARNGREFFSRSVGRPGGPCTFHEHCVHQTLVRAARCFGRSGNGRRGDRPEPGPGPGRARAGTGPSRGACRRTRDVATRPSPERWPSGRRRTPGKCVGGKPSRGFESLSLRQKPRSVFVLVYIEHNDIRRLAMSRTTTMRRGHRHRHRAARAQAPDGPVPRRRLRPTGPCTPPTMARLRRAFPCTETSLARAGGRGGRGGRRRGSG